MIEGFLFVLTLATAIACGLVAGFFFAFSACMMKALARLPASRGVAAMQSINVVVINPWVMGALFGTALACAVLVVAAFIEWGEAYAVFLLVGGLLYLVGVIVLTIVYHVPRNNALMTLDPDDPDAASHWNRYVRTWTAGNHVRTVAPLATAVLLTIAIRVS
ncbi:MAG TPA: anthrone oxygenase family protein [Acidimicrobiia bacterium]|nr:anthrone oxygenase family protein [Acidimicrobiia bacterium]